MYAADTFASEERWSRLSAFSDGEEDWLARLGELRDVVRQSLVTRQLARHLPTGRPIAVLDVGSGRGLW